LGVISCGSGNDWQRTLGHRNDAEACLNALISGNVRPIDIIRVNGMACVNIGNMGLDARIVQNAAKFKKFFGKNAYTVSAVISILEHKNISIKLQIDDGPVVDMGITLAAVCNGQYYGGNMRITPSAKIDDGLITLCLVKAMKWYKLFPLFPIMLLEKHTGLKVIQYIECKKVAITTETSFTLCLDGNLFPDTKKAEFEILPGALTVSKD